ncbi:hypothetical protein ACO2I3_20380 [Leptospira interrogans]
MPQVIALAIAGAGLFAGYKWLSREVRRALDRMEAEEELQRAPAKAAMPKDLGALEWDQETGVYRPIRRD